MMRSSAFTGYYIWNAINTINNEMSELQTAMNDVDRDSLPHQLLKKEYQNRRDTWDKMQKQTYTVLED